MSTETHFTKVCSQLLQSFKETQFLSYYSLESEIDTYLKTQNAQPTNERPQVSNPHTSLLSDRPQNPQDPELQNFPPLEFSWAPNPHNPSRKFRKTSSKATTKQSVNNSTQKPSTSDPFCFIRSYKAKNLKILNKNLSELNRIQSCIDLFKNHHPISDFLSENSSPSNYPDPTPEFPQHLHCPQISNPQVSKRLLDSLNLDSSNKLLQTLKLGQKKATLPLSLSPCQSQLTPTPSSENEKSKVYCQYDQNIGFGGTCLLTPGLREGEGLRERQGEGAVVNGITDRVCLDRIREAQTGIELSYRLLGSGQI